MSSKSIIGLIFHRKLMLQALLLFNSQHMRRALATQEWMRKQNHGSCYSKHRLWWLLNSDSVCSSLLPLLFVKMADDSAVLKLFSETFFSLSCSFVHTYLQGAYLVERKNCYSCWQQSNGVSRGQKDGVGHLGDIQTIKWTGGRGSKKEEEAEERQDVSSALTTKELSELPHYITEEAPKHDRITRNNYSFGSSSQEPGSLCGPGPSLHCLFTSPGRALRHRPTSHCHTPSSSHQSHPDPSSCSIARTKLLLLLL